MSFAAQVETSNGESPIGSSLYAICTTAASTAAKTITMDDFDTLVTGTTIHVKFTNTNTAADPTLAVGSTSALPIIRYGTTAPGTTEATSWKANSVLSLTYDGTYWRINDVGAEQAIADAAASALTSAISTSESGTKALMAPTYSASSTYKVGQLVIYNGQLYVCTTAISTAEAWNSSHWGTTTLYAQNHPRKGSITMTASSWSGSGPWTQTVTVSGLAIGVTARSIVSLQPDSTALSHMASVGCAAIYVSNNNGTLTAYAIQKKPTSNLTIQCIVTEVSG